MFKNIFKRKKSESSVLSYQSKKVFDILNSGDIAIDCGANVGKVTEQMAAKGATVYAFEPNPYAFEVLQKKFADNPDIHCFNQGVLDKESELPLYLHEHSDEDELKWSTGSSFISSKGNIRKDKSVVVKVIDIVDFITTLPGRVKILKLDVEGVEIEILNKLIDTGITDKIDLILAETHEDKMPELKDKTEELKKKIQVKDIQNINLNWI